jgi:hypothetical protein
VNRLASALAAAVAGLSASRFAIVGGIAVSARTQPRFTRDLDLAVAVPDDAAAETIVRRMVGHAFRLTAVIEQDRVGRLATARLLAPGEPAAGIVVDLLFASSGIEQEIAGGADPLEVFSGVVAPVARTGHLIALKVLARDDASRPQDAVDLRALLGVATEGDVLVARESVRLIARRGFDRGRDLPAALELAVEAFRGAGQSGAT